MALTIKILESAQSEIDDIVTYLESFNTVEGDGPAERFTAELEYSLTLASENPYLHAVSRIPEVAALGFRVLYVSTYVVLYAADDKNLYVSHVFHQRRDYGRLV